MIGNTKMGNAKMYTAGSLAIEAIQKMIKKNYSNMEIQEFYDVSDSFIEKIKIDSTNVVSI